MDLTNATISMYAVYRNAGPDAVRYPLAVFEEERAAWTWLCANTTSESIVRKVKLPYRIFADQE